MNFPHMPDRLGWTLVHFLWQGALIAILYAGARRAILKPSSRYLLACGAMTAMLAAPLATWLWLAPPDAIPEPAYRVQQTPSATHTTSVARTILPVYVRPRSAQFLPWVVIVWLIGAVIFWARLVGGWVVAHRIRSRLIRRAPPEWQETLRKLGVRIGLSRRVELFVSALVPAPTVIGWLRPVVLMPVGALTGLPFEQLEALLLHELAHIRRHDYLVNLLQSVAEALLFYHPAVWWISGHIRDERELCCDDAAVSVTGDVLTYARALTQLESYRPALFNTGVAAHSGSLPARVARLLGQPQPAVRFGLGPGVLAIAILLMAAAFGLFGQSNLRPAFESVSIKPNASNWSEPTHHVMSMSVNASLMLLIQFAYANHNNPMLGQFTPLPASQVVGGPGWINSLRYDIQTKPGPNTDPKQEWLMWQTLLADRFKLRLHRETRELPLYDLTVAKNGPKLPAAKEAGCVSFPPRTTPRYVPGKVDCGYVAGPFEEYRPGLHIEGRKVHVTDLVRELALILDRPVLDQTAFAGEFDLDLTFTPDAALMGLPGFGGPGDPGGAKPPTDPNLPNIFAALEDQLGLKLVAAKGPVEVLVIDHAEMPNTN